MTFGKAVFILFIVGFVASSLLYLTAYILGVGTCVDKKVVNTINECADAATLLSVICFSIILIAVFG